MKNKLIEKRYLEKINLFHEHNKAYHLNNKPKINDDEFDKLKEEILLLEKKFDFLKSKKSPSQSVGFKPSKNFKKVKHKIPMLSLGNAFNENDLKNFEKKY